MKNEKRLESCIFHDMISVAGCNQDDVDQNLEKKMEIKRKEMEIKRYTSKGDRYTVRLGGQNGHGSGDGEFKMPYGMTSSKDTKMLYVCDGENRRVQIFSLDGEWQGKFGSRGKEIEEFEWPRDVAMTRSGDLAIVDSWNHRIQIHSPEGTFIQSFGKPGKEGGQLRYP